MDTNNNEDIDRNELRRHCNKLLSFVNDNYEDLKNVENQHLIGVMHQTEELYRKIQKSSDSSAMVIDSKIMKQIGSLTRIQASQMSANIYKFSSDIFVLGHLRRSLTTVKNPLVDEAMREVICSGPYAPLTSICG